MDMAHSMSVLVSGEELSRFLHIFPVLIDGHDRFGGDSLLV